MSEAKVGLSANVWVEVVGLFMVVLDLVNAFGFVPLHVLKPAMRINVSINMHFGIAAFYSRESTPAMPIRLMQEPIYEVHPRKDKRGVDLISDALPFGRLCLTGSLESPMIGRW